MSLDLDALSSGPILITGATGFLGGSLARRLVLHGKRVRALVRSTARAAQLRSEGVEIVIGDITDEVALAAALDDVTVVYHLAGKLYAPGESAAEYHKTHVDGTRFLVERSRRRPRLERFVHCSTTGVLGVTGLEPLDEEAPFNPTNAYEATKGAAEQIVRAAIDDGFPAVIARPGLVYGPGDIHLAGFFRTVLGRRFRPIGRAPVLLHPIYIEDMTDALILCGTRPEAVGECFHFAGLAPVSLERLANTIAREGGTRLPRGRIPLAVARAVALAGDALPGRFKQAAPLTRSRLEFLTHSRVYSVAKAEKYLDFIASTELPTGIASAIAWYRQNGYLAT